MFVGEENSLNNQAYCKTCHAKESKSAAAHPVVVVAAANNNTSSGNASFNNVKGGCRKCGKSVGIADKVKAAASEFHKDCFQCHECNRTLTLVTYKEDKEHNVFCDACYKKTHANAFGSVKKGLEKMEVEKLEATQQQEQQQEQVKVDDGGLSEITGEVDEVAKMLAALNKSDEQ